MNFYEYLIGSHFLTVVFCWHFWCVTGCRQLLCLVLVSVFSVVCTSYADLFCFVFVVHTCCRGVGFFPVFFLLFLLRYERISSSCCNVLCVCLSRWCCCRCDCVLASVFCLGVFGPGLDYFLVKCLVPGAFLPVNYYSTTPFILLLCSLRRRCFLRCCWCRLTAFLLLPFVFFYLQDW